MKEVRHLDVYLTPEELAAVLACQKNSPEARALVNTAAKLRGLPDLLAPEADYGVCVDGEIIAVADVFPAAWRPQEPS